MLLENQSASCLNVLPYSKCILYKGYLIRCIQLKFSKAVKFLYGKSSPILEVSVLKGYLIHFYLDMKKEIDISFKVVFQFFFQSLDCRKAGVIALRIFRKKMYP